ncbi:hypothetical protein BV25DRAFT_1818895 [Artomyces pyxidatus]|uniref:Uncharacterized protein n=1 Tax=Artomyces pyxidatus TaxID=48021 RepID=A0ACB8TJ43_9AGAM|nr:hypothetical protein BV25DRAFT_1818895 [Artomyces pyxidatus]
MSSQQVLDALDKPPYYILVSHSGQQPVAGVLSKSLSHPIIQYHYADDSPLTLLPRSPEEQVLVLDYDPSGAVVPRAQSLTVTAAVSGVRVADAPGAGASEDDRNSSTKMFILDTTGSEERGAAETTDSQVVLTRFKQRNSVLRQVLEYENQEHSTPIPQSLSPK